MSLVLFPRYRQYDAQRIAVNDAVMALLAGSKLSANVLQLTSGSTHRIAELFPNVRHIERLNLRADDARLILESAESHVGSLAIPYILSLHEGYMMDLCSLLKDQSLISAAKLDALNSSTMHEELEAHAASAFSPTNLSLFHYLRLIRNSLIHQGGFSSGQLANKCASLSSVDEQQWKSITGEPIGRYQSGQKLNLTVFELIATLAIAKRLAEEANHLLQSALPRSWWISTAVADWLETQPKGNLEQKIRRATGFARIHYGAMSISRVEIEAYLRAESII
ncbi:hypothetical protein [Dermacoccus sp. NHGro5]|uniref:hypothetical protein n=1 Tax=Dermacoccus TaxID=57495 RepID=UPI001AA1985A|nr:hypothetical protein [Dermacoccus sp. NHGro5]MBO1757104.1 hypothetical protein [Dermacoccus sp. NHGro5]